VFTLVNATQLNHVKSVCLPVFTWKGWHIVLVHPVRSTASTQGHHGRGRETQKTLRMAETLPTNLLLL
jgi:hypothetical protein